MKPYKTNRSKDNAHGFYADIVVYTTQSEKRVI